MKKYIISLLAIAFCMLGASSCSDFLEVPVLGQNADTPEYYNDPENAKMALVGCYNGLAATHKDIAFKWMFGDVRSDDAWKGGGSEGDGEDITKIREWRVPDNEGNQGSIWSGAYRAIFYCNTAITGFEYITFDDKVKELYIAEAKAIRAYNYFMLATHFGDAPLFTKTIETSKIKDVTRAPFAQILEQVESDLRDAAAILPAEYGVADAGRMTSGAAKALHARVVMYSIGLFKTKDASAWQEVYDLTNDVINSGAYSLYPNYAEIFEIEGENNSESVLEFQFKTTKTGWGNNQGNPSCVFIGSNGIEGNRGWGWNFCLPTQNLVDEFEDKDPRLYSTVHGNGITDYVHGVRLYVDDSQAYQTGYNTRKSAIEPAMQPTHDHSDGPANERIIRYADVLLMKAEAAYYLSKEGETRSLINQVRERARKSTYPKGYEKDKTTYAPTGFSNNLPDIAASVTGEALMKALKHERRVEFALEGLRYWDLARWGDYKNTLPENIKANFEKRHLRGLPVLPIPQTEVTSWGLTQNPL